MNISSMLETFLQFKNSNYSIDSENWTESDTRSKFIDTIFKDCLAWKENDIRRELSSDRKRLDYIFSTTRPVMIVEAKRASNEFDVLNTKKYQKIKTKSLINACPSLKTLFSQVAEYCWKFSVPIAVLTNGKTYITFIALRTDGIPWEDGDSIVYNNIFSETFNFSELYNLLSRESVTNGSSFSTITVGKIFVQPRNVLSNYNDPNAVIQRNPLGLALEPLLMQVFSDVTRDDSKEVLENCYVLPGETKLHDEEFEAILLDKPPRYVDPVVNVSSKNAFDKFQQNIKDLLSRQRWSHTIYVIGGIGVGKTMFLRRYFSALNEHDTSVRATCAFTVDFRKTDLDLNKISDFIYEKLKQDIIALNERQVPGEKNNVNYDFVSLEGLKQVFWPQLQKFAKGPKGELKQFAQKDYKKAEIDHLYELEKNDKEFVKGSVRVLRERYHRNVCIILDNADQCNEEYQKAVYLFSRTLESNLECLVIVALREEWYWYFGKRGGPLSAYHDVVYHIPAPRVRTVLEKRLDYALKLLDEYAIPPAYARYGENIILEARHLYKYLTIFKNAFINNEEITLFYECISNGNIRKGLDVFLDYLRSGHTHVDEYLKAILSDGNYDIAFHQVFRSVSRGAYQYYSSEKSSVPNVFFPVVKGNGMELSYFSRVYFLTYLEMNSKLQMEVGLGYVSKQNCTEFLLHLGLSDESQKPLIESAVANELIEPDVKMCAFFDEWKYFRITSFGLFMLKVLIQKFTYFEAIMLDLPINNTQVHHRISGLYLEGCNKPSLHQRLLCVKDFVSYLQKEESLEHERIRTSGLSNIIPRIMDATMEAIQNDYDSIEKTIKNYPFS